MTGMSDEFHSNNSFMLLQLKWNKTHAGELNRCFSSSFQPKLQTLGEVHYSLSLWFLFVCFFLGYRSLSWRTACVLCPRNSKQRLKSLEVPWPDVIIHEYSDTYTIPCRCFHLLRHSKTECVHVIDYTLENCRNQNCILSLPVYLSSHEEWLISTVCLSEQGKFLSYVSTQVSTCVVEFLRKKK